MDHFQNKNWWPTSLHNNIKKCPDTDGSGFIAQIQITGGRCYPMLNQTSAASGVALKQSLV
jgi:hypothetical protein